jgi:hypothetical protein
MAGHRHDSSPSRGKLRQRGLEILNEGDLLLRGIDQHLRHYDSASAVRPSVDAFNLREAAIELGNLLAWASDLIAAQSLVSYRSSVLREVAEVQRDHSFVGSASVRDNSLDSAIQAFVQRVRELNDSLGGLEWD